MKKFIPFLALLIMVFSACKNNFEKILKSKDYAYKLKKADEYYDRKSYTKSNTLYEELLTVYKGTKSFEAIYYKYAYIWYVKFLFL